MPFIAAADGTQLYWRDWGQGAPLLFLNSLGMSSRMWDYQITALAEAGFRCIGFDRRGHGQSDQPARGTPPGLSSAWSSIGVIGASRTMRLTRSLPWRVR